MFVKLLAMKQAHIDTAIESFLKDTKGATAIEYGLIAGGISLAIVAAVFFFGDQLTNLFNTIGGKMQEAADSAAATP